MKNFSKLVLQNLGVLPVMVFLCTIMCIGEASGSSITLRSNTDCLAWRTLLSGNETLNWVWPQEAMSARLTILTARTSTSLLFFDKSVSSWTLTAAMPQEMAKEAVYSFVLDFFTTSDASGEEIAEKTLRADNIGSVRGVCGDSTRVVPKGTGDAKWHRMPSTTAVMPIFKESTELEIKHDGASVSLTTFAATPCWFQCGTLRAGNVYSLEMRNSDGAIHADVMARLLSTMLVFF